MKLGQQLKPQERLGLFGSTGFSSRPHLHFSVFQTIDGESRRTIPIQFKTADGQIETLKDGEN